MVANGKLYSSAIEKLNFEPRLDASNITVTIRGNYDIVVLGGTVKTFAEKIIAENAIKSMSEVRGVVDEIKVDSSNIKSDIEIAEDANRVLKFNVMVPNEYIKIVVENGYVTLSGEVEWKFQRSIAMSEVSNLSGVKFVINNIIIKPSIVIDINKVKEQITKEFERHARIDASKIEVEVEGTKITLKGEVSNFDEMNEAEEAAWSIPGVANVQNELTIK